MTSPEPWSVGYSPRARQDLKKVDRPTAVRLYSAVRRLANAGQGDVRRLRGEEKEWRLRVGDWRVRLELDHPTRTIRVLRVLHRSKAYRD